MIMKRKNKILSLLIVMAMLITVVTPAFGADRDLKDKATGNVITFDDYVWNDELFDELVWDDALDGYYVEVNEEWYEAKKVNDKMLSNPELTLVEAVEDMEPVGELDDKDLEVVEVSAINPTAIKIEFNQKVDEDTAEDLDHYYFGLTEGTVVDSKLISGLNNPKAVADTTNGFKATLLEDGKTVIISAENYVSTGKVTIWEDKNNVGDTALVIGKGEEKNIVKNKTAYIQVRDMRLANGELADTVQGSFLAKDTTPADFVGVKTNYDTDGKVKGVSVTFTEPVHIGDATKLYLDSRTLTKNTDYELSVDGKVLTIKNDKLDGKHKLEIVGLEDLAGNRVVGDVMTKVFEVKALEDPQAVIPKVISVDQIHDGAFKVRFNTEVTADLTIKNLIADKDVDFGLGTATEVKDKDGKVVAYDYTIEFASDKNDVTDPTQKWEDVYKTSNKIDRVVEIKNIKSTDGKKAESDYRKVHTFVLDNIAPVVHGDVKVVDGPKIQINFYDGPFNGEMKLGDSIGGKVIIKQTIDGETKTVALEASDLTLTDERTIEINLTDTKFDAFKDDNNKVKPGNYTISLPDGLVVDGAGDPDETPQFKFKKNALVGTTLSFEIKKDKDEGGASVPQTAQGLVSYDEDEKAIVVKFVGEDIDVKTAINPANYTFAGKVLDADTKIEYESSDDIKGDNSNVKGAIVRIYLKDNTVVRDGSYTLTVKNVATKSGAKMLPTTVRVDGLKDNTAPLLIKAVVTGDGQIELTFNESIDVVDLDKAAYNFQVLVGGTPIDIKEVKEKADSDDRILVLHTTSTFDADKFVIKVVTTEDVNGDMFITDKGGNKLAAGTEVTATKLGK